MTMRPDEGASRPTSYGVARALVCSGLFAILVAACPPANRQVTYIAPSYRTIVAEPEESPDGVHQSIYMANHSTESVVLTRFQLIDCVNVANPCQPKQMRILNPGQRALVATIGPVDRGREYSYRYTWTWDLVTTDSRSR